MKLSAKCKIPVPRQHYIVRTQLFDLMKENLQLPLMVVCGGAGTGKTTLVSSFIREQHLARVGWFSVDQSCADRYSFWVYAVTALTPFAGDEELLSYMRLNPDTSAFNDILQNLAELLSDGVDRYLVIDDFHFVTDPAVIASLTLFLSVLPETLHIIFLTRERPLLYFGRYAVAGKLLFITAEQLKLSDSESRLFLQQTLHYTAKEADVMTLVSYADGWIGGLQLAAAAAENTGRLADDFTAEYLNHELFEALLPEEQYFLLVTGILSYFSVAVAADIIGPAVREQCKTIIASLAAKNLFLICIDEEEGLYRYHHILSDFLSKQFAELPETEQKNILLTAADVFKRHGDLSESLRLYICSKSYEQAVAAALLPDCGIETWAFFDQIPVSLLIQTPEAAFRSFLYNLGVLNIERCRILYDALTAMYRGTAIETVMQFARQYVEKESSMIPEFKPLGREEIEALPLTDASKAMVYTENAIALTERMRYEDAELCLTTAVALTQNRNAYIGAFIWGQKAQLYEETGQLNESLLCYDFVIRLYRSTHSNIGIGTNFYIGATGVHMARMELDEAQHLLDESKAVYEKHQEPVDIIDMTIRYHCAEMQFLKGNDANGKQLVSAIIDRYPGMRITALGRLLKEEACAEILDADLAQKFLAEIRQTPVPYRATLFMQLLEARMYAVCNNFSEALARTDAVLAAAREHRNQLRLAEGALQKIYLLTRISDHGGREEEQLDLLREALAVSWENTVCMPFFLERRSLLPVLKKLLAVAPQYNELTRGERLFAEKVSLLCGEGSAESCLSAREQEVLEQLAHGITNKEIADVLCISVATVKTHIINIYGKLGVSNRVQAVDEASRQHLLE